jgi:DUF2950 family protein
MSAAGQSRHGHPDRSATEFAKEEDEVMGQGTGHTKRRALAAAGWGMFLVALAALTGAAGAEAAKAAQRTFATPEEAVRALVEDLQINDTKDLLAILGRGGKALITSGDDVADWQRQQRFLAAYAKKHTLVPDGATRMILQVGEDNWPLPIPLVQMGSTWRFDTRAGLQEVLRRRIGRNELAAIQTCRAIVDAQLEYASADRLGTGVLQYAQRFISTPGTRDGLFWDTKAGEPPSPLGPLVAQAAAEGYRRRPAGSPPAPFQGYFFRLLTRQGPQAPGGALDYVVQGRMIGGFALVAYPARYGNSGVMTFLVNQEGVVYEKNLGPKTAEIARAMTEYDPDQTWKTAAPAAAAPGPAVITVTAPSTPPAVLRWRELAAWGCGCGAGRHRPPRLWEPWTREKQVPKTGTGHLFVHRSSISRAADSTFG